LSALLSKNYWVALFHYFLPKQPRSAPLSQNSGSDALFANFSAKQQPPAPLSQNSGRVSRSAIRNNTQKRKRMEDIGLIALLPNA
jgi:hypothetical protein